MNSRGVLVYGRLHYWIIIAGVCTDVGGLVELA